MPSTEGMPSDDAGLLRRTLDGMGSAGLITIDRDSVIVQVSGPALDKAPTLLPGLKLRQVLEEMTHVEMVDRMLIGREMVTFPPKPGAPECHWLVWGDRNNDEELIITFWDTDWNDKMTERRAAFTMAASHELRGPLTTILGFSEVLNMNPGDLTPEQAEAARMIEQGARHLSDLVDDVFDLSRNSFGELRLDLEDMDLEEVLEEVCSFTKPGIEDRNQSLGCEVEGSLPTLTADRSRVRQMITNLVRNASTHNDAGISITVVARVEGNFVAVIVEDDGKGLPFNDPEEAFRTFRRGADATTGDRTGSGIGLSVTKRLIELHRGHIDVESSRGAGTKFTLWFPIDRDTALQPRSPGPA